MQKRRVRNHNDKYVVFFEFDDEQDELDEIEEPLSKPTRQSTES
ncbi:hypothetical protein [Halorhabdus rudnickae]|nr:hypothetical protein [Halorhabdus rudnickae]